MAPIQEVRERRRERVQEAAGCAEAWRGLTPAERAVRFARLRSEALDDPIVADLQEALDFNARLVTELVKRRLWEPA
jgi:hypothetical protein